MTDKNTSHAEAPNPLLLLTGATGYVGGRLLRQLEESGRRVRCLTRHPESLEGRVSAETEVVAGDVLEPDTLGPAMQGVTHAFYLVHSMGSAGTFVDQDREAARNFARAAEAAGVQRMVYLGGLAQGDLSPHLESRIEVGRILRESSVPTIELRASIIIGSGSLSFEMIRTLVRKLPVMVMPRWTRSLAQPIAIEDVVAYLAESLEIPIEDSRVYEIGGGDVVSYRDLMREYADQRGLRRIMIPVPVLSPGLSSLWLGLVTPLYARIGRKLIGSARNETTVKDDAALRDFSVQPRGTSEAIARALANEDQEIAETRWSDALSSSGQGPPSFGGQRFGSRILDSRSRTVSCPPEQAFAPIRRIGGKTGWYFANFLWRIRGLLDLFVGGVGLRRGRKHPEHVLPGDTLDWWRVERVEPGRLLRLRAEMRVPGRAWLQFEVSPRGSQSEIRQTAIFDPAGLGGLIYWYALWPLHAIVFRGMIRQIARAAEQEQPPSPR